MLREYFIDRAQTNALFFVVETLTERIPYVEFDALLVQKRHLYVVIKFPTGVGNSQK